MGSLPEITLQTPGATSMPDPSLLCDNWQFDFGRAGGSTVDSDFITGSAVIRPKLLALDSLHKTTDRRALGDIQEETVHNSQACV